MDPTCARAETLLHPTAKKAAIVTGILAGVALTVAIVAVAVFFAPAVLPVLAGVATYALYAAIVAAGAFILLGTIALVSGIAAKRWATTSVLPGTAPAPYSPLASHPSLEPKAPLAPPSPPASLAVSSEGSSPLSSSPLSAASPSTTPPPPRPALVADMPYHPPGTNLDVVSDMSGVLTYAQQKAAAQKADEENRIYTWLQALNPPQADAEADFSAGVFQSVVPEASKAEIGMTDEVFAEDCDSFPETSVFLSAATSAFTLVKSLWDSKVNDPEALKVKAMKYEALINTLNQSFADHGILSPANRPLKYSMEKADYNTAYLDQVRGTFEKALVKIRVEVEKAQDNPTDKEAQKYYAVCYDLYTKNSLQSANTELLDLFQVERPSKAGSLLDKIKTANTAVSNVEASKTTLPPNRWGRSLIDSAGLFFSPIGAGNPPQKMFEYKQGDKDVSILGFGSPTMQGFDPKKAIIDPLFIGYLEHLKVTGQKHLYVSNQNALSSENVRNAAIMHLQNRYRNNFIAITQTKNTAFYSCKDPLPGKDFAMKVHSNFFDGNVENTGCHLPEKLKNDAMFRVWSVKTKDDILETYFPGKTDFTKAEQKFFIETYYNLMTMKIVQQEKVDFLNFTCKDGIDRGMGSLGWFTMMVHHANQTMDKQETEEMMLTTFFTRAYWTRKRNIIHERLERVLDDTEMLIHLDNTGEKTRGLLIKQFGPMSVTPARFSGQASAAMPSAAAAAAAGV